MPMCTPGIWTEVADYPIPIQAPAVASDGSYVYSAGGQTAGSQTNSVFRYDPSGPGWIPLAPAPIAITEAGGAFVAGTNSFYVFGGLGTRCDPLGTRSNDTAWLTTHELGSIFS